MVEPLRRPVLLGAEWVGTRAGGLNRYLADLAGALTTVGVSPAAIVVGPTPTGGAIRGVSAMDAPLLKRMIAVRRAAKHVAPEAGLVDAHFALYALLPIYTTALRRLPLVVHFQGPWAEEGRVGRSDGRLRAGVKRVVERAVYRRAEVVVVLSEAFARVVTEEYGVDPARVVVVPPGVDLDRFSDGGRATARTALGVDPCAFVVVAVRRLDARMGLDVLLEAWELVRREWPSALLLIAGEGRERQRLEAQRDRMDHPDAVRFLGGVSDDELRGIYAAADCSVVPSRSLEGFGLVTLESLASGTPAVVTDVGGLPDAVRTLDPSLVVPLGDVGALAARLLAAASGDVPTRASCRSHAERFTWDAVARRHVEVYETLMAPRPVRVAFLGHTAVLSGGELALSRLLPSLRGVEATVVLAETGPLADRLRDAGHQVRVVPMSAAGRLLNREAAVPSRLPMRSLASAIVGTWRLTAYLRSDRPDLVHTNTLKAALYGGVAGRLAGVPVVWHVRDRIAEDYLPKGAVRLVRAAVRVLPAAVIANSDATLATLGRGVARSTRVHDAVVPSPISLSVDAVVTDAEGSPLTVGLVGRLAPWKGQDLFLRAFAEAFPDGDERARIVGSAMFGEEEWVSRLARLASDLGVADRVDMVGFVDDVSAEYVRMHILVHASTTPEPFGQVVAEGLAAGLPVVAADAGGPAEIITNELNGLLYPMGDVHALAAVLRRLAGDPSLRQELGAQGRRRARDFAPERVGADVRAVYDDVLRRRRRVRRRGAVVGRRPG